MSFDLQDTFSENEDEDFIVLMIQLYKPKRLVGSGAFSNVYEGEDQQGNPLAIKVVDKNKVTRSMRREVEILSLLQHKNIVSFYASRESLRKIYIITELVCGVPLEEFFIELNGEQIVYILRQLLSAVQYVHSKDIIHRDIKPENILIDPKTLSVKLIDFGLSFQSSHLLTHENCGTLIYMAPEMALKKEYFKSVDIWSCGIIQYMLFSRGTHPIWEQGLDNRQTYLEKLQQPNFQYKFPSIMNNAAISFFVKTVSPHPESRMSAAQALIHPWITGFGELSQPITMADMVQTFQSKQNLLKIFKIVLLIQCVLKSSIKQQSFFKKRYHMVTSTVTNELTEDESISMRNSYMESFTDFKQIKNHSWIDNNQKQYTNIGSSKPSHILSPQSKQQRSYHIDENDNTLIKQIRSASTVYPRCNQQFIKHQATTSPNNKPGGDKIRRRSIAENISTTFQLQLVRMDQQLECHKVKPLQLPPIQQNTKRPPQGPAKLSHRAKKRM